MHAKPIDCSRFIEHITEEWPTMEELEMTGALTDPFQSTRNFLSVQPLAQSLSAPPTPSWPAQSLPNERERHESVLSRMAKRMSWRNEHVPDKKPSKKRLSTASISPPTLSFQAEHTAHARPTPTRSTSAPFSIPQLIHKRKAGLLSPRLTNSASQRLSLQLPAMAVDSSDDGISPVSPLRPSSFEILSRPASRRDSSSTDLEDIAEMPCAESTVPIVTPKRSRVISTPSSSSRREPVYDLFPRPYARDSSSSPEDRFSPQPRRHSLASVSSDADPTPPMTFTKRPLYPHSQNSSSYSFSLPTPSRPVRSPSKSLLTNHKPPSVVLLPLAASRIAQSMPGLVTDGSESEATLSTSVVSADEYDADDPFLSRKVGTKRPVEIVNSD